MAIASINPTTGECVAMYPEATAAEVEAIVASVAKAQRVWSARSIADRAVPMRRAAMLLRERASAFARLMAIEVGKPLKDGVAEIEKCAWACEHYAANAEGYLAMRNEPTDAGKSYVRFDPIGVVLVIMPWNFPYWQVFRFLAPGLMAGNGALLKHAPNVPQCALSIETLLRDAGFAGDLMRTLLIEAKGVESLVRDARVAAVTLTGSEGAGRAVGRSAGEALKPMVLELGGSDPFLVLASADVDEAAKVGASARMINAGQSCIAAKRFIIEAPIYERFVGGLVRHLSALKLGDPFDPATEVGPLARLDLRDALHAQVQKAITQGAKVALGCEVPRGQGAFYPPSVLTGVTPQNIAAREELFGPVAVVMMARDEDHAIELANSSKYGLGASVWVGDAARGEAIAARIDAGAVFVNGLVKSDPRLPFGGVKASGVGRELSVEGARAFTNVKSVWIRA